MFLDVLFVYYQNVVIGKDVYQVYTRNQDTSCCITRLFITKIVSSFTKIPIWKLGACFWQDGRLIVSQFGLFFFKRLRYFFFFTGLPAFSIISIYFANFSGRLEDSIGFSFDGFIQHLFQESNSWCWLSI